MGENLSSPNAKVTDDACEGKGSVYWSELGWHCMSASCPKAGYFAKWVYSSAAVIMHRGLGESPAPDKLAVSGEQGLRYWMCASVLEVNHQIRGLRLLDSFQADLPRKLQAALG